MNEITLPWMPRELSPNARVHWAQKSKAAKAYRYDCYMLTKEAMSQGFTLPEGEKFLFFVYFYPPSKRHYDDDNLVASFKAGRDGIAEALGVNDKCFVTYPNIVNKVGGMVKVRFSKLPT